MIVEETLQGIATVKAFVNEEFEYLRYQLKTNSIIDVALKVAKWRGAFASFIIFCLFGSIIAVIWYGVILVQANEMSMGDLFTFILYSVFVGALLSITEGDRCNRESIGDIGREDRKCRKSRIN